MRRKSNDAQEYNSMISFENESINYLSIVDVKQSKSFYYKDGNDYRAGYIYRIITSRSEIYNTLYIEKIVFDAEGFPVEIEWTKRINTDGIFQKYGLSEETDMLSVTKWNLGNSFIIVVGDILFDAVININSNKIEISKK